MDKQTLDFLTNKWHNAVKDQVVLHGICNLLNVPYTPVKQGISAFNISSAACHLFSRFGITKHPTGDIGTCSLLVQELLSYLVKEGLFTREQLQSEINNLFISVYTGNYITALGPF